MFKKTVLKDGLRIITVPDKSAQAVTVLALVGTGSKYETKELNGISHFLEHMYFAGTKKRPSTIKISETLDKIGGIYNAFTSEEYTGYFAKVDAGHFDIALEWVSDIFLNSQLPEKELEKEKGVIIEEINMSQDQPMSYVRILWYELLYGDQPAGWFIAGTKETVSKISKKDLLAYMKNQYVAENTIVCVSGNINEKSAINKIGKYFSKIAKTYPKPKQKVVEKQTFPSVLLYYRDINQTNLCLGVRGYNMFHPQKYTLDILGSILGGMMSSRLFEEVRNKLGLAYYIHTDVSEDTDTGFLMTQAGVDNQKVDKAILTILNEYKKISEYKVPAAELKKAKDNFKGKLALLLETSDAKAVFYSGQELLEKKTMNPQDIFDQVDKISADDILKVAKDIFRPEGLNLALIGPFKDKKRFEKLLNKF